MISPSNFSSPNFSNCFSQFYLVFNQQMRTNLKVRCMVFIFNASVRPTTKFIIPSPEKFPLLLHQILKSYTMHVYNLTEYKNGNSDCRTDANHETKKLQNTKNSSRRKVLFLASDRELTEDHHKWCLFLKLQSNISTSELGDKIKIDLSILTNSSEHFICGLNSMSSAKDW